MSMATNYRYEVERPGAKNLRKALKRQRSESRYEELRRGEKSFDPKKTVFFLCFWEKNDELNSEQEAKVKSEIRVNQIAEWMEKQEENSERRLLKQWAEDTKQELSLANKELTAVRRAQLRNLLYTEQALYEIELNNQGKTFFIQRT
ncbi:unnamed protein product [Porites evermanni]|uniref:Uncharacterized protein n=1 Tax=Porites evermanni TaxID=104178 RepID=A0ABN8RT75_9CNID|nr:unnamed protein product [Porites evermanni]